MPSGDYRVRIATLGAAVVAGNVALTLALDDIGELPTITGPRPSLLKGTSTSVPFQLDCLVDDVLFVVDRRLAVIGRLCELQENLDGAGWSTVATGRIKGCSEMDGRGKVTLQVTDERWVERDTEIFRSATSAQLHPVGLTAPFRDREAAGTTTYVVMATDGDYVRIQPFDDEDGNIRVKIPAGLVDVVRTDLKPPEDRAGNNNPDGNFTSLRFEYLSTDRTIVNFNFSRGILLHNEGPSGPLGTLANEGWLQDVWVYIPSHGLSATDQITGRFYFANGYVPTKDVPLLIGGVDGVHPATLARDMIDGAYGGDAVNYPTAVLDDLEDLNLLPVWARIEAPADRAQFLEKNFYHAFGIPPLVGTDLELRPTPLRLPQDVDPTTLPVLTASNSEGLVWDHTGDELVNVVVFKSKRLRPLGTEADRGETWSIDEYELVDAEPLRYEHDTISTLGEHVHTIETDLIFQSAPSMARVLADDLFDVFGDGASKGQTTVSADESVEVGDLVMIDQDSLKGFNPEDDARTGDRLVQLVAVLGRRPSSTVFGYLDKGPDAQPLSAPTISVAQDGTDADLINVTISGLAAGETAVVEATAAASSPSSYDHLRGGVGNETIQFRLTAGSGTAYVRAYATALGRIRSAYATDTVALSTRPIIVRASVVKFADFAQVQWTVDGAAGMRLNYDTHVRGEDPTLGGNVDVDASTGFHNISDVPPGDVVTVQLTPYTGWTGSAVSGTAGDATVVRSGFRNKSGFINHDDLVQLVLGIEVTFDENGEAVVSADGPEGTANLYVTVGDGTTPADPTSSSNDGAISGQRGTVSTGVKISTGNDAIVKVVAADIGGNLGEVSEVTVARRMGPFHKDTTDRSVSSTSPTIDTLETITIPGGTLGDDGILRLTIIGSVGGSTGNREVYVSWDGVSILNLIIPSSAGSSQFWVDALIMNDGSESDQDIYVRAWDEDGQFIINRATDAAATGSDVDIDVQGRRQSGDIVTIRATIVELLGTI